MKFSRVQIAHACYFRTKIRDSRLYSRSKTGWYRDSWRKGSAQLSHELYLGEWLYQKEIERLYMSPVGFLQYVEATVSQTSLRTAFRRPLNAVDQEILPEIWDYENPKVRTYDGLGIVDEKLMKLFDARYHLVCSRYGRQARTRLSQSALKTRKAISWFLYEWMIHSYASRFRTIERCWPDSWFLFEFWFLLLDLELSFQIPDSGEKRVKYPTVMSSIGTCLSHNAEPFAGKHFPRAIHQQPNIWPCCDRGRYLLS